MKQCCGGSRKHLWDFGTNLDKFPRQTVTENSLPFLFILTILRRKKCYSFPFSTHFLPGQSGIQTICFPLWPPSIRLRQMSFFCPNFPLVFCFHSETHRVVSKHSSSHLHYALLIWKRPQRSAQCLRPLHILIIRCYSTNSSAFRETN